MATKGAAFFKKGKKSGFPSSYAARGAKWRKFRKNVSELIQRINNKGHEHITLMIASHSANTPVYTLRISKYIILFIACLLAITVAFSVAALADKSVSDPEIVRLTRHVRMQEEALNQFARNTEKLESGMKDFVANLRSIVEISSGLPLARMRLSGGATPYPNGRSALAQEDGFESEIRILDSINLNILRAAEQASRLQTLIYAMRPHVRFKFFRYRERRPVGEYPNFWPVDKGGTITSPFGDRFNPFVGLFAQHKGADIANTFWSIIRATYPGEVVRVDNEPAGYGLYVDIKHDDGYITRYAHMDKQEVFQGDLVYQGQIVGRMGHTGLATGDHLHYEVIKDGEFLNPEDYMENRFRTWDLPQP